MEDSWIYRKCFFFRSVVHDIVDNPFFEWTVLLLIFASRWDSKFSLSEFSNKIFLFTAFHFALKMSTFKTMRSLNSF